MWTIGLGMLSTLDEHTSLAKLIGYQILCGAGAGQTFQTGLIAVQAAVSRSESQFLLDLLVQHTKDADNLFLYR